MARIGGDYLAGVPLISMPPPLDMPLLIATSSSRLYAGIQAGAGYLVQGGVTEGVGAGRARFVVALDWPVAAAVAAAKPFCPSPNVPFGFLAGGAT